MPLRAKENVEMLFVQLSVCPVHPGTTTAGDTCAMCDLDELARLTERMEELEADYGDTAQVEERIWSIEERLYPEQVAAIA